MKTLLEIAPTIVNDNSCMELADRWKDSLVSFHARRPFHAHHIETIGTGAIVERNGEPFIATAKHVLDDYQSAQGIGVFIKGKRVGLDGMKILAFREDTSLDMVLIQFPRERLLSVGVNSVLHLPIIQPIDSVPTKSFLVFGYPASKNVLDSRVTRPDRGIYATMLHGYNLSPGAYEIGFRYREKELISEPWKTISNPPALRGMSGAPVAQIFLRKDSSTITLRSVGVFHSWREKKTMAAHVFPEVLQDLARGQSDVHI